MATTARALRAKITSKGQITVPVEIRRSLGVEPGDKLRFEPQEGSFRVVRTPMRAFSKNGEG